MPLSTVPSLTGEEIDNLIYYARVGDLTALTSNITEISNTHSVAAEHIISAAIDQETDDSKSGTGCCLLHWPAANGNAEILNYLLLLLGTKQEQADGPPKTVSCLVNHKNRNGNTPLHWAAVNGHLSCVKTLVERGADPATKNDAGYDALYEADCSGKEGGREVAEWILANCVGPSFGTDKRNGVETTADETDKADVVMMDNLDTT